MPPPRRYCTVEGCDKRCHGQGLCNTHYRRKVRAGAPVYRMHREIVDGRRICSACGEDKLLSDYGVNRRLPDGLHIYCRACVNAQAAARRDKRGAEAVNEDARRYRARTPRYWYDGNHRRRARIYGRPHERIDAIAVYERDNWTCQLCGCSIDRRLRYPEPGSASLDHVSPLKSGGWHVYENVQAAHWSCNFSKECGSRLKS